MVFHLKLLFQDTEFWTISFEKSMSIWEAREFSLPQNLSAFFINNLRNPSTVRGSFTASLSY